MNLVDWVLLGAIVVFALIGWRRGFVAGLFSFVGFLGAGLLVALILPKFVEGTDWSPLTRGLLIGAAILVASLTGQFVAGTFGDRISDSLVWRPARVLDHVGGAILNLVVLAVVTWMVATVAGYLPASSVTDQISQSTMVTSIEGLVPPQTQSVFSGLEGVLKTTSVPTILGDLQTLNGPEVAEPSLTSLTPAVRAAGQSVVRVFGNATECGTQVSGSGFVISPHRIVTNAHVVAGVNSPKVQIQREGQGIKATVVYFNPETDIAVLYVPSVFSEPLPLAKAKAATGDPAAAAGFPHSGPYALEPVRVRTSVNSFGQDIYGSTGQMRDVYLVRGSVQKGMSGGPLLAPDGTVLGLIFGSDPTQQTTGYAIADTELVKVIDETRNLKKRVDTDSCAIRD
ncbi:MAG: MarP family serine protease [Actinomycetes bacterium]